MAIAYAHPRGIKDFPMRYMYNKVTDTWFMVSEKNLSNDEMNVAISRKNSETRRTQFSAAQETETNLKPANSLCKACKAKFFQPLSSWIIKTHEQLQRRAVLEFIVHKLNAWKTTTKNKFNSMKWVTKALKKKSLPSVHSRTIPKVWIL